MAKEQPAGCGLLEAHRRGSASRSAEETFFKKFL